jgi:hypothetical protein
MHLMWLYTAKTCSDKEVGQDNKLHLRQKYMYTSTFIKAIGSLNTVLCRPHINTTVMHAIKKTMALKCNN